MARARPPALETRKPASPGGTQRRALRRDTFRAAAVEQLESGRSATASRSSNRNSAPIRLRLFYDAVAAAKARSADVVIVDTAGRLHTKSNLMPSSKK